MNLPLVPGARSSRTSALALAGVLAVGGTLHLVAPTAYEGLIPRRLGSPRAWVLGSGVAEFACAAAVAHPATRRAGGLASAALFVAVFPGNVTMATRAHASRRRAAQRTAHGSDESTSGTRGRAVREAIAWARLPLQVPLVLWALAVADR